MRKEILYDKNAAKELRKFARPVQLDFQALIEVLKQEGKLDPPEAKKISKNLFEMRVIRGNIYRGLYAYVTRRYVVVLQFFQKKTQRIPLKDIRTAEARLKKYV